MLTQLIGEARVDSKRTGRHIEHDDASWNYKAVEATALKSVEHERRCAAFNQGNLGSCTGNAMAGLLMTDPFYEPSRVLGEPQALQIYELGTVKDGFPGEYPPNDTGSSGLGVARAAKSLGYITSYRHAFGLDAALRSLVLRPVITGVPWYDGFDNPDSNGLIKITGSVRGGHEFLVNAIDVEEQLVWAWNSWGPSWGKGGRFCFSWETWGALLKQQGDVMTVH